MITPDWDYPLPKNLIAQEPLAERDQSRLLVADRKKKTLEDRVFKEIINYFKKGDVLVLNNTKVFPARILAKKKLTEGKVEILLLEPRHSETENIWKCLVQPALKEGQEILLPNNSGEARFVARDKDGIPLVEFIGVSNVREFAYEVGTMPLPPYIKREASKKDEAVYQTVFATTVGAVAAPTAGLHFTQKLLREIQDIGVEILFVTLHVGYGTFKPVEDPENHEMHSEWFELSEETAQKINEAKARGNAIWAVGTTALRTLETCVQKKKLIPGSGHTNLFIKPPFEFEIADHLITNFHLPKTTLLLLVSAFMGDALLRKAYEHAIQKEYRFYSYGDAMLIL